MALWPASPQLCLQCLASSSTHGPLAQPPHRSIIHPILPLSAPSSLPTSMSLLGISFPFPYLIVCILTVIPLDIWLHHHLKHLTVDHEAGIDRMLRLRPTTIGLTLDDIQLAQERVEARKRAAFRHSGRVKVRRGPERSRDEAITPFERIPSLQAPRRAEHISDSEDFSDTSASDASKPRPGLTGDEPPDPHVTSQQYQRQQTRPGLVLASQNPQSILLEPYINSLQFDGHFDTASSTSFELATCSLQPSLLLPDLTDLLVVFVHS